MLKAHPLLRMKSTAADLLLRSPEHSAAQEATPDYFSFSQFRWQAYWLRPLRCEH